MKISIRTLKWSSSGDSVWSARLRGPTGLLLKCTLKQPSICKVGVEHQDGTAEAELRGQSMSERVFAYGSNMCLGRFLNYEVQPEGPGTVGKLAGYSLKFNKLSNDGSGKANVVPERERDVWGVLYAIPYTQLLLLDRGECGYARMSMSVETKSGAVDAWVYVATLSRDAFLRPYSWYKRFLVQGAGSHDLPAAVRHCLGSDRRGR